MLKKITNLVKSSFKLFTLKELKFLFKLKQEIPYEEVKPLMVSLTFVGSAGVVWFIPILLLMKDKSKRFDGLLVVTGIAFDVLFNNIVTKYVFRRQRPWTHFPDQYHWNSLSLGYSFPSGHALTSSTAATIFILIDKKNALWAIPLASGISFSRLVLFAHHPSDVIVGILDGMLVGELVYKTGIELMEEGKLPRIKKLCENDFVFKYLNFFKHPLEYIETIFKILFLPEKI